MTALIWILSLMSLLFLYSKFWHRQTEGKVRMTLRAGDDVLLDGDEAELTVTLENFSWVPIPWVSLSQQMPKGLLVWDGKKWSDELVFHTFLFPRQRVQRRCRLQVVRGLHKFDRPDVGFGDGLGMQEIHDRQDIRDYQPKQAKTFLDAQQEAASKSESFAGLFRKMKQMGKPLQGKEMFVPSFAQVLVRPRPFDEFGVPFRLNELIGERAVVRWYQEDASRLQGVRAYAQGDPFKNIHWAATARVGDLMVKQFETTSEMEFCVLLNTQFFDPFWSGTNRAMVNYQCRLAASLFRDAEAEGFTFRLLTNASWSGPGFLHVPAGRGPMQLEAVMSALGGLLCRPAAPFEEVLQKMRAELTSRALIMLVTPFWNEGIAAQVEEMRRQGHHVTVLAFKRIAHRLHGLHPSVPVLVLDHDDAAADEVAEDASFAAGEAAAARDGGEEVGA